VSSAQKALNSAKLQLAGTPLPPQLPQVTPPPAAVAQQMQPRLTAVTSALSSRIAWDRILREFSLVMPPDVQVSSITLTQPAASTQSAQGLQLSGMTFSYDGVARLLSRMALIPDLTGVTLSSTSFSQNVVSFTINAAVKGAAVPATPTAPTTPEPGSTTTTTSGTPS
jgi:Tfp pilus assembly protein PilN